LTRRLIVRKNRRYIMAGVAIAAGLTVAGLSVSYGWLSSKSNETVSVGAAQVKIWSNQTSTPGLHTISVKNLGDREIYLRIGAIAESTETSNGSVELLSWGDSDFFAWLAGASATLETATIADGDAVGWISKTKASLAVVPLKGVSAKKAYINIVNVSDNEFAKINPGISFSLSISADALPSGTKLQFFPEAIQGTEECLAYMKDSEKSGLAAPWVS
jgi:hypothetical protein